MLAKLSSNNPITIPKSICSEIGANEYFEVKVKDGEIILTPVKVENADLVRAKLANLGIVAQDVAEAIGWARQ